MNSTENIVIVDAIRTPIGGLLGVFKDISAPQLGSAVIKALIEKTKINIEKIDEVIMGCVLSAGLGQAPARQAALHAHLSQSTACTTVNKMCGSGMKAVMLAHDQLQVENTGAIIAGGLESMTGAPYLLPKARSGYRAGHAQLIDHLFFDGLEDAYDSGKLMGYFADETAKHYGFTREAQDNFAIQSLARAQYAINQGYFKTEITPVTISDRTGTTTIYDDEQPGKAKIEKIPSLKPAFSKDGTVTAANASSISDGAAALLLMRESMATALGLKPRARIIGHASFAHQPNWFTTAPVGAIKKLLTKIAWSLNQVDLFEINEAFAVVALAAMRELELSADKVNIYGGACALGHPIGASGARILVTLINALEQRQLKRGVASLCIGGGEATAMAIELT